MHDINILTVSVVAALFFGGCGEGPQHSDDSTPQAPQVLTGVIVGVDSAGLGDIRSFELKKGDETWLIFIDPQVDYGFDVGHLSEHLSSGQPVTVEIDARAGKLFASSIGDA